jgi:hypothetical protein
VRHDQRILQTHDCWTAGRIADATGHRRGAAPGIHDQGWGLLTQIALPGGGKLGVYQPRHARPPAM